MRQKRLAKLAAQQQQQQQEQSQLQSQSQSQAQTPNTSSDAAPLRENERPAEVPSRKINITPSSSTSSPSANAAASNNPFSQLGVKNRAGSSNSTPIPSESGNKHALKRSALPIDSAPANTSAPAKKLQTGGKEEKLEDWSDRVLGDIFRVTLDETRAIQAPSSGAKLTYLSELRSELEQSNEPVKLTASSIDAAILEATRNVPPNRALLDYLLPCWKRVTRALKLAARRPNPERDAVLNEARRLCMSNCVFAVTMPEYFG